MGLLRSKYLLVATRMNEKQCVRRFLATEFAYCRVRPAQATGNGIVRKENTQAEEGIQKKKKKNEYCTLTLPFEPVFNSQSRILILGTFPSVKSREQGFYYGHPQNRFWKILATLLHDPVPLTIEEKKRFLLRRKIAIWDVVFACDIIGSSDSSIKNPVPTDLPLILKQASIQQIFANGGKAYTLYQKYSRSVIGRDAVKLPSSSPANASWQLTRLLSAWNQILPYLDSEKNDKNSEIS